MTAAEGRKFALTVGTAFLVFGGIAWWRDHALVSRILGGLGAAFWIAGLTVPALLGPVQRFWMGLAHVISRITTPVILGVVYFLVMMPIGTVMRLLGRNPIKHQPVNDSFWAPRTDARGRLTNQF